MTYFLISLVMLLVFLFLKGDRYLLPSNIVFANYFLYFIMPSVIYFFYDIFDVIYILPWGKINDWSTLSSESQFHFLYCFILVFLIFRFFELKFRTILPQKFCVITKFYYVFLCFGYVLTLYFTIKSGGLLWLTNYENTYLSGKKGLGFYNIFLIWYAHFLAFFLGICKYHFKLKMNILLYVFSIIIIIWLIYIQGVKSRIPLLLLFYFSPVLLNKKLKLFTGFIIALLMIILFSVGMYFRSEGFYSTPRLALEYLLSYFNTVFLHEIIINDYKSLPFYSLFNPLNKYLSLFGETDIRSNYDLSVMLTQIYYPEHWKQNATQQWPLETSLLLGLPYLIFWMIPITLWSFTIFLWLFLLRYNTYFLFPFVFEMTRIFSVFRGGILSWEIFINYIFIFLFFLFYHFILRRIYVTK